MIHSEHAAPVPASDTRAAVAVRHHECRCHSAIPQLRTVDMSRGEWSVSNRPGPGLYTLERCGGWRVFGVPRPPPDTLHLAGQPVRSGNAADMAQTAETARRDRRGRPMTSDSPAPGRAPARVAVSAARRYSSGTAEQSSDEVEA